MRILLVSCYELGHQPVALAGPAGALGRQGHQVVALDLSVEMLDEEAVRSADLCAISVPMHTALRLGARVATQVRALHPRCHIVFFGLYAELNATTLLQAGADTILGEAPEQALVELAVRFAAGESNGVGLMAPASARRPASGPAHRSGLPPLERYARAIIDGEERLAGAALASRGCLHLCRHCPIPPVYGGRFFATPVETVMEDVRALVALGARHITFADPDFFNGPVHARRLAERLHTDFPDLTFDVTVKVEHLLRNRDLLPLLAASGCRFIVSAVESLSDTVLRHLDKGHTGEDVEAALALCRQAGIALRPSLVAFTPWTGAEDFMDVLDWVDREALWDHIDPVQYTIRLLVPPGSLLLQSDAMKPHLGPLDPPAFTYAWTHPDPRMDELAVAVRALVEQALAEKVSSRAIVERLRARAEPLLDRPRPRPLTVAEPLPSVPRLTEPWFCCAEPAEAQVVKLGKLGSPRSPG